MYRIPTILTIALLMLAGPALTGTSALEAQTCPPSVCSGPPPPRGPFGVRAVVNGTTVTLSWELPPGTNIFLEVFIRQGPRILAGWVGAVSSVTGTLPPALTALRFPPMDCHGSPARTSPWKAVRPASRPASRACQQ